MILLDGKKVSSELIDNYKKIIEEENLKIKFAIIWVGDSEASSIYVNNKIKKCESVGIDVDLYHLSSNTKEEELLKLIDDLNNDSSINGILVQSPIGNIKDESKIFNSIDESKDIDGFSKSSIGNLVLGTPKFVSCTPLGIMKLLDYYKIDVSGKHVVIINRSNIVGKPLFQLLINRDATVTMCHSKTTNLSKYTRCADILITAVGKPKFITCDMVSDGVTIIDVGISRVNGKVLGDVDFEGVKDKCYAITPVPGGVGPMTITSVLNNLIESGRN